MCYGRIVDEQWVTHLGNMFCKPSYITLIHITLAPTYVLWIGQILAHYVG